MGGLAIKVCEAPAEHTRQLHCFVPYGNFAVRGTRFLKQNLATAQTKQCTSKLAIASEVVLNIKTKCIIFIFFNLKKIVVITQGIRTI